MKGAIVACRAELRIWMKIQRSWETVVLSVSSIFYENSSSYVSVVGFSPDSKLMIASVTVCFS